MRAETASTFRAGMFVLLCLVVVIISILALGRRTQIFVPQYQLVTVFQNAAGLIRGAAVRVAGVNVGSVRSVQVVRGPSGAGARVVLEIARNYQDLIREDSRAMTRTIGALGDRYVEVAIGTPDSPVLTDGATLKSEESLDFNEIAEQARQAIFRVNQIAATVQVELEDLHKSNVIANLSATTEAVRKSLDAVNKGPSLAHSVLYDPGIVKTLDDIQATARALRASAEAIQQKRGPLGEVIYGDRYKRALDDLTSASASAKDILHQIQNGAGDAHTLIYHETATEPLAEFTTAAKRLNVILAQIEDAKGTLGMLIADPSVWDSLKRILGGVEESRQLKFLVEHSLKSLPPPEPAK